MIQHKFIYKVFIGALFSLFAQFACSETDSTLIAAHFGELPKPENINRVISAGPVPDTFLVSLVPNKLLGFSTHNLARDMKKYFPENVRNLPSTGRIAGRDTTFPLEKVVAFKPDIIVDIGSTSKTYISTAERIAKQTGIPYVVISGKLNESAEQLRVVGNLLGVSEHGNQLGDYAEKVLTNAANIREQIKDKPPVKLYFGRGSDGLQTGLSGSIHMEAVDISGAYNVASEAGKDLTVRVSMEQLLKWNPEVIITQDKYFYNRLTTDPIWQKISAVKNKRFYLVPSKPYGWVDHPPSINRLLGVVWLSRVLYPELMSYEQYAQDVTDYYQLFYGYQLTKEELASFSKGLE